MRITCGIFFIDENDKLLIGHPTGNGDNVWSIPKGESDVGEDHKETAYREFHEETGLNLNLIDHCVVGELSLIK